MKAIFEEYGGAIVTVAIVLVLLVALGIYNTSTNKGSGVAKKASEGTSDITYKYKQTYFDTHDFREGIQDKYVSKEESQVGNYVDYDNNGTIDGVIFADLLHSKSGTYNAQITMAGFAYGEKENKNKTMKDYYVSGKYKNNITGNTSKNVLVPTSKGKSRFMILSLRDYGNFTWYKNAKYIGNYYNCQAAFGNGQLNCRQFLQTYPSNGSRYSQDIWTSCASYINSGWFIPSDGEWAAIANNLNIDINYNSKGFQPTYWSSTLFSAATARTISLQNRGIINSTLSNIAAVRLARYC